MKTYTKLQYGEDKKGNAYKRLQLVKYDYVIAASTHEGKEVIKTTYYLNDVELSGSDELKVKAWLHNNYKTCLHIG